MAKSEEHENPLAELVKAMGLIDNSMGAQASSSSRSRMEPSAAMRSCAAASYDFYIAHVQAGFTNEEALMLLQNWHTATLANAYFEQRQERENGND